MFRLLLIFLALIPLLGNAQGNSAQTDSIKVSSPLCKKGFSQKDSFSVVNKKVVRNFHRMIFDLAVDTIIDSTATYKLLYVSTKEWSQGFDNPKPKKQYCSKYYRAFDNKRLLISDALRFQLLPEDRLRKLYPTDSLFLDEISAKISNDSMASFVSLISLYAVIQSSHDDYFKELRKPGISNLDPRFVISFGGKYLFVAITTTYVGNSSSWRTVEYHYYQKVE